MHVLMISARGDYGGGPEHVYQLVKGLISDGAIRISVALPKDEPYWQRFQCLKDVTVFDIPHRRFQWSVVKKIKRFIKQERVTIVHTHGKGAGAYGFALSWLTPCQFVHTPHGIHLEQYGLFKRWIYRCYENQFSRRLACVIYVSGGEKKQASTLAIWCYATRVRVILNGVPNKLGLPPLKCTSHSCQYDVVVTSRFDYQKNMQEAFAIAQALPDVSFLWLGDGPDRETLMQRAQQQNLSNVEFKGFVGNAAAYLKQAKIYLSTSRWEGLPLSLLEAFACGLPAVVSDVVGNKDAVESGKTGFCYPLGQIEQAIKKIEKLLKNNMAYQSMSQAAHQSYLEHYTVEKMCQKTVALYDDVTNGRGTKNDT